MSKIRIQKIYQNNNIHLFTHKKVKHQDKVSNIRSYKVLHHIFLYIIQVFFSFHGEKIPESISNVF